jgi:flavin-dependent dehydrogenase
LGVRHNWGVKVVGLTAAGIETERGHIEGRWCIGADGLRSQMRNWAGLEARPPYRRTRQGGYPRSSRFGVRGHFALKPWSDCVEVLWADGCEGYVTPVGPDEVGVAFLWSGEKAGFDTLLERFPRLERKLRGARSISEKMGSGPFEQRTRGVWSDRVALVGDAAGYRDAITGEGLALAFHQAQALARALAQGNPGYYQRAFRKMVRLPFGTIRVLLLLERRPIWRRRLIQTLAADRGLFERLLAVHSRHQPLASIGLSSALGLVWKVAGVHRSF